MTIFSCDPIRLAILDPDGDTRYVLAVTEGDPRPSDMKLWHPLVGHHLEFHHRLVTRPVKFRRPEQTDIVRTTLMPHQVVEIGPQGFSLQVVEDSRRLYIFAGICKKPLLSKAACSQRYFPS